ncbi:hypothetical protein N7474_004221 [Penicillium riverlandense]|uniref:uncharacterized protein n=1 Tax=Penicillium riverlandense TaxID=1903569 RepID=UPI002548BB70|nr:uncharacterized protein N7474_004221 [Penicillium riverlandense]KAJ5818630.1 hypothetical protein N7474_004221 [Penicillium riverlandense]
MSSKSQTEGLELAELVFYAIASLPATYCLIKHGRPGLLGWLNVLIFCGLRIASNAMAYHDMTTTGNPNKAASIISGIGLSPLLLAALNLLNETNTSIRDNLPAIVKSYGSILAHWVIIAGVALAAASSNGKLILLRIGLIVFGTGWMFVAILTYISFRAPVSSQRADGEKKLLIAIMAALPLIGVRILYGIAIAFVDGNMLGGSLPVRVILGTLPEFLVMIAYVGVGLVTRNVAEQRLAGSKQTMDYTGPAYT